jgi:hypothetical protein
VSDLADAVGRMREMNAALSDWDRIREEGERISREEGYAVLALELATLRAENERLRAALVAVAEQDGTLSVSEGVLFVDVDGVETLAFDYLKRTK